MKPVFDWLDDRVGYRGMLRAALFEHIPGGARWRYVWGSTLIFAFAVQMVTGFFLWMAYSPSSQTAWESVYYIQHEMSGGWLLRGIHHYTAQAMIVLLGLHMAQVIIDGAYRAPREVNFWIGLVLMTFVLGLSLTGYLLPWDQKGYWATKVATSIMASIPVVGPGLQRLVIGGPDYGHHTLTRFFAVHAGLLPFLMIVFTAAHVYVFRRHGLRHKEPKRKPDSYFWVDQVLRDAVACLGVLAVVLLLVFRFKLVPGGSDHLGAELGAPADPSEQYSAARPEWYFLFLFQFLKYFPGPTLEFVGSVVIPSVVFLLLLLMPILGRWRVGHLFNMAFFITLLTGVLLLTTMAIVEDSGRPALRLPGVSAWIANVSPAAGTWLLLALVVGVLVLILTGIEWRIGYWLKWAALVVLLSGVVVLLAMSLGDAGDVTGPGSLRSAPALFGDVFARLNENLRHALAPVPLLFALLVGVALLITLTIVREQKWSSGPMSAPRAAFEVVVPAESQSQPAPLAAGRSWRPVVLHRSTLLLQFVLLGGVILLTAVNVVATAGKPEYHAAVKAAGEASERVVELARRPEGIPPAGAVTLLRRDPQTQGPKLFALHCSSCHAHDAHGGDRLADVPDPQQSEQSAANLTDFAGRDWIAGLLDPQRIATAHYFGGTKFKDGEMVQFVQDDVPEYDADEKKMLGQAIDALAAEAKLPGPRDPSNPQDAKAIEAARAVIGRDGLDCTSCHAFYGQGGKTTSKRRGPDLTGYGSEQWLVDFIHDPTDRRFYGERNDRMPAYGKDKILDRKAILLVVRWLRGDYDNLVDPAGPPPAVSPAAASVAAPDGEEGTTQPATAPVATAPTTTATAPVEEPLEPEPPTTEPTSTGGVDFVTQVKPLFEANCVKCHGPDKSKGKFRLDTVDRAFTPGKSDVPPIVPGKSGESRLFQMVSAGPDHEDLEMMPPEDEGGPLEPGQIELLRRWIDAGAPWPEGVELAVPPAAAAE